MSNVTPCPLRLIGSGIQLSRSPDLDRRRVGLADLESLLREAEDRGLSGVNVTHPAKKAVLAELSPEARALEAVNTVVFADGARTGHNTDSLGFAASFRHLASLVGRNRSL